MAPHIEFMWTIYMKEIDGDDVKEERKIWCQKALKIHS